MVVVMCDVCKTNDNKTVDIGTRTVTINVKTGKILSQQFNSEAEPIDPKEREWESGGIKTLKQHVCFECMAKKKVEEEDPRPLLPGGNTISAI